jgi:hypothetical protein
VTRPHDLPDQLDEPAGSPTGPTTSHPRVEDSGQVPSPAHASLASSGSRPLAVRSASDPVRAQTKSDEHRAVGEAATAGALVPLGGDCAEERCVLSYGDVIALSGDFFTSHHPGTHGVERTQVEPEDPTSDDLFRLTAIPGKWGTEPGTRDEIICALKVMAVDGAFVDTRFEPGGQFSHFRFTATAAATRVERRVRDRFLALATANGDHFVAPGRPDTAHDHNGPRPTRFASALVASMRWPWTRPADWDVAGMTSPGQWPGRQRPSTISPMPSRRGTCGLRSQPSATSGITATHSSGRACNAKSPPTPPRRYENSPDRREFSLMASCTTAPTRRSRPAPAGFRSSPWATCWPGCFTTGTQPRPRPPGRWNPLWRRPP